MQSTHIICLAFKENLVHCYLVGETQKRSLLPPGYLLFGGGRGSICFLFPFQDSWFGPCSVPQIETKWFALDDVFFFFLIQIPESIELQTINLCPKYRLSLSYMYIYEINIHKFVGFVSFLKSNLYFLYFLRQKKKFVLARHALCACILRNQLLCG